MDRFHLETEAMIIEETEGDEEAAEAWRRTLGDIRDLNREIVRNFLNRWADKKSRLR